MLTVSIFAGHIHGFLWLKNVLPVDDLNWNDNADRQKVTEYFSQFLMAFNPDSSKPCPAHDCLFNNYSSPELRMNWDLQVDHCDLCNRCWMHRSVVYGKHHCSPSQCYRCGACHFHFPYPITNEPLAFIDGTGRSARKKFATVRNNPWLNQHSKLVLLGWRANVDLQPVLDREAAIAYISKYVSKPEVLSTSYHTALTEFCTCLLQDSPVEHAAQWLFARMAADRDISTQKAVHLLLGDNLVGCSHSHINQSLETALSGEPTLTDNRSLQMGPSAGQYI